MSCVYEYEWVYLRLCKQYDSIKNVSIFMYVCMYVCMYVRLHTYFRFLKAHVFTVYVCILVCVCVCCVCVCVLCVCVVCVVCVCVLCVCVYVVCVPACIGNLLLPTYIEL